MALTAVVAVMAALLAVAALSLAPSVALALVLALALTVLSWALAAFGTGIALGTLDARALAHHGGLALAALLGGIVDPVAARRGVVRRRRLGRGRL